MEYEGRGHRETAGIRLSYTDICIDSWEPHANPANYRQADRYASPLSRLVFQYNG